MVRDSIEIQNSINNYEYTLSNKPYILDLNADMNTVCSPHKLQDHEAQMDQRIQIDGDTAEMQTLESVDYYGQNSRQVD